MILAVTGHRKIGGSYGANPLSRAVVARIGAELDRLQPTRVISGMALGVDQWLAALAVKRGVPFTAAVPFIGQDNLWRQEQKDEYERLLERAEKVYYTGHLSLLQRRNPGLVAAAMGHRNEWMVDNCDVLLAVWDGSDGGTANCVRHAQKVGREIVRIDPRELKT